MTLNCLNLTSNPLYMENKMEFLRFGSSIPGSYWGCCACCIIQNFKVDPDAKASIQLVGGDGGNPILGPDGGFLYAGPTWRDIFWQRLRFGTFNKNDMPNHAFLAILTASQISGGVGAKWLAILKEAGFEFIRTVDNSVYTGQAMDTGQGYSHPNYIFGLFRNIGNGAIADPHAPPQAWLDLPEQTKTQREVWDELTKKQDTLMTEAQLVEAGVPVMMAGLRSKYPQEPKSIRDQKKAAEAHAPVAAQQPMVAPQ